MSFPEWGRSFNALSVPLTSDWQCSLVPIRDLPDVDHGWKLSYDERQKARKERDEQIEQDRHDFDRWFRVSIDRRAARFCSDFGAYAAFIREHLRISGLSAPVDGDGVTRILRDAVRDGHIVPAISRAWWGSRRVARQYAPQSWPKRTPDPKPTIYSFRGGQLVPLDANGRFIDDTPYVPARVAAKIASMADAGGGDCASGFDWLGAAETVAGAVLGCAASISNDGSNSIPKSFGDTDGSDGGSLLGDAQPFEYQADMPDGEIFDLAKTPNNGEPGTWYTNSGSGQMRLYGNNGQPAVDFDFDHDHGQGIPHAHNWSIDPLTGKNSRGSGVPFSILP
jgi:hypothetical protein